MQYGIYLPNFGPYGDARVLADLAREAEQAGWDGFFLWDHIAGWKQAIVDPWVALAAIAMNTERIRIGTTVTPVPRRRPWKLARETVSIDRLSGGRLILGVGIGVGDGEWGHLGEETDLKTRGAMLDEGLAVLTGLWSGQPFDYDGQYYHVQDACFLPTPVQQPRIPIWAGGFWPNKAPFKRAAHWDGMFPLFQTDDPQQEPALLREVVAFVRDQRPDDSPFDVVVVGQTPGDDPTRAEEIIGAYQAAGMTWWAEMLIPFRFGGTSWEDWPVEALRQRVLQGPPKG